MFLLDPTVDGIHSLFYVPNRSFLLPNRLGLSGFDPWNRGSEAEDAHEGRCGSFGSGCGGAPVFKPGAGDFDAMPAVADSGRTTGGRRVACGPDGGSGAHVPDRCADTTVHMAPVGLRWGSHRSVTEAWRRAAATTMPRARHPASRSPLRRQRRRAPEQPPRISRSSPRLDGGEDGAKLARAPGPPRSGAGDVGRRSLPVRPEGRRSAPALSAPRGRRIGAEDLDLKGGRPPRRWNGSTRSRRRGTPTRRPAGRSRRRIPGSHPAAPGWPS